MAKIQPDIAMPNRIPAVSISSVRASMLLEIIMMPVAQAATANIDWHIIRLRRNFFCSRLSAAAIRGPHILPKGSTSPKRISKAIFFSAFICANIKETCLVAFIFNCYE